MAGVQYQMVSQSDDGTFPVGEDLGMTSQEEVHSATCKEHHQNR